VKGNCDNLESDQLWGAFKKGDKTAFEKIYRRYVKDLLNYGYKVIPDRRLIEDSIQDLFFELWESKENLSQTSSVKFYLMGFIEELNEEIEYHIVNFSHENYIIELEVQFLQTAHLNSIIEKLPKRQQEALNLRYYHNFSNDQIAEIMEINYQSACKFIYSALKNLKLNLKVPFHH
jgi:RNA polymerase sigma factor (sigma-70 family)